EEQEEEEEEEQEQEQEQQQQQQGPGGGEEGEEGEAAGRAVGGVAKGPNLGCLCGSGCPDSDGEQPRWRQQQPAAEPGPDVPARAAARGGARGRPRPRRPTAGQAPRPSPDRGKSPRELSERVGGRASLRGRPRARSMPVCVWCPPKSGAAGPWFLPQGTGGRRHDNMSMSIESRIRCAGSRV
ncbi:unnamed protein product, partial [Prorocentrum cordatum]